MKERPILFSGPMVRAILALIKSMTRRTHGLESVNARANDWLDPTLDVTGEWVFTAEHGPSEQVRVRCPYGQPGDRLWVRETHFYICKLSEGPRPVSSVAYRADRAEGQKSAFDGQWRPSIYMPRWASRITLEITGARVERLQEISRGDAMGEGCPFQNMADGPDPRKWFAELWSKINGRESWDANPWVWVVEFRRV